MNNAMSRPMGPSAPTGAKDNKNAAKGGKSLIAYLKPYLPVIIAALVAAAGGTVLTILGPDKLKDMTNAITAGLAGAVDMGLVAGIGAVLICFYAASALLSFAQNFVMNSVTQRVSKKLRSDISRKINKLPLKYFDKVSYGDVLSRVTNDVDTIGQALNQSIGTLVSAIVMFIGALVMMFLTNWIMALTAILATAVGFGLMLFIMSKSQKYFVEQQRELGSMGGHIEEIYSGHSVVKVYGGGKKARAEFDGINAKLERSGWKSQFISGLMQPLMGFIGNFGYVAVCVVGAVLALGGSISFGVIVAFMMYVRLFTQPLSQMAQAMTSLQQAGAAGTRVFEFFDEEELAGEDATQARLENVRGNVEFENVRFGYDPEKIIINDFSATVRAGQKVAIVGPTGAGKTTMVNLLMRFYELSGGSITIDGVPIDAVTRENVHEQFCMVLQDTWLFEGTIRENIIYDKEGVDDAAVVAACKAVGLHAYIKTLPKGYDTVLSDSSSLSQGQKQLLTIARAMVQDAPMLILDEATSSVDTRTEQLIQQAMDKLMAHRTSFVIAHRLSTIKNADLILMMKDGDIIESGTHDELIAQCGAYSALYNSQFELAA